jgi:hypothetical protein
MIGTAAVIGNSLPHSSHFLDKYIIDPSLNNSHIEDQGQLAYLELYTT